MDIKAAAQLIDPLWWRSGTLSPAAEDQLLAWLKSHMDRSNALICATRTSHFRCKEEYGFPERLPQVQVPGLMLLQVHSGRSMQLAVDFLSAASVFLSVQRVSLRNAYNKDIATAVGSTFRRPGMAAALEAAAPVAGAAAAAHVYRLIVDAAGYAAKSGVLEERLHLMASAAAFAVRWEADNLTAPPRCSPGPFAESVLLAAEHVCRLLSAAMRDDEARRLCVGSPAAAATAAMHMEEIIVLLVGDGVAAATRQATEGSDQLAVLRLRALHSALCCLCRDLPPAALADGVEASWPGAVLAATRFALDSMAALAATGVKGGPHQQAALDLLRDCHGVEAALSAANTPAVMQLLHLALLNATAHVPGNNVVSSMVAHAVAPLTLQICQHGSSLEAELQLAWHTALAGLVQGFLSALGRPTLPAAAVNSLFMYAAASAAELARAAGCSGGAADLMAEARQQLWRALLELCQLPTAAVHHALDGASVHGQLEGMLRSIGDALVAVADCVLKAAAEAIDPPALALELAAVTARVLVHLAATEAAVANKDEHILQCCAVDVARIQQAMQLLTALVALGEPAQAELPKCAVCVAVRLLRVTASGLMLPTELITILCGALTTLLRCSSAARAELAGKPGWPAFAAIVRTKKPRPVLELALQQVEAALRTDEAAQAQAAADASMHALLAEEAADTNGRGTRKEQPAGHVPSKAAQKRAGKKVAAEKAAAAAAAAAAAPAATSPPAQPAAAAPQQSLANDVAAGNSTAADNSAGSSSSSLPADPAADGRADSTPAAAGDASGQTAEDPCLAPAAALRNLALVDAPCSEPPLALPQHLPPKASWMLCPITRAVLCDPVVAADRVSYERAAIEAQLRICNTSPQTGRPSQHSNLIPNHALRSILQAAANLKVLAA